MNNKFDLKDKKIGFSGKEIKQNRPGIYICEGNPETIFLWVSNVKNFILIEKEGISLSISNWDNDTFFPFNGTVEFNN